MYDRLRREMTERGITVVQIAKWFNISRQAVHRKLNGTNPFTHEERRILARRLRKSIAYLFEV